MQGPPRPCRRHRRQRPHLLQPPLPSRHGPRPPPQKKTEGRYKSKSPATPPRPPRRLRHALLPPHLHRHLLPRPLAPARNPRRRPPRLPPHGEDEAGAGGEASGVPTHCRGGGRVGGLEKDEGEGGGGRAGEAAKRRARGARADALGGGAGVEGPRREPRGRGAVPVPRPGGRPQLAPAAPQRRRHRCRRRVVLRQWRGARGVEKEEGGVMGVQGVRGGGAERARAPLPAPVPVLGVRLARAGVPRVRLRQTMYCSCPLMLSSPSPCLYCSSISSPSCSSKRVKD